MPSLAEAVDVVGMVCTSAGEAVPAVLLHNRPVFLPPLSLACTLLRMNIAFFSFSDCQHCKSP